MISQIIDQKEHKNNWYKFEPATWCYKHHSTVCELTHSVQNFTGVLCAFNKKKIPLTWKILHSRRDWRDWQISGMNGSESSGNQFFKNLWCLIIALMTIIKVRGCLLEVHGPLGKWPYWARAFLHLHFYHFTIWANKSFTLVPQFWTKCWNVASGNISPALYRKQRP